MADVEKDIVLRVKSETDQAQGQFKSLKSELRSMEQQLQQMEASGQAGTEAFKQLQQQAGKVKDQIGDTKNAIKALSSDTFKLDAFAQAAQGIAGGFAAAQGAISLFGGENKAVEEAIRKTQGAMALLQGVTAITNVLQKESALRLGIASVAQATYTTVVGASTGAMKLFRLALASTGIGALVVGLGMLISNFDDVKKTVLNLLKPFDGIIAKVRDFLSVISFGLIDDASTAKTKANAEESLKALEKVANHNKSQEKVIQRKIDLAKAEGKSAKEVLALEKELIDFRLKNNYAEQDAIKRKIQLGNASDDEKKKLYELVESARDLVNEKRILEINYTKKVQEETEKRIKAQQKEAEEKKKQLEKIRGYEAEYEKNKKEQSEKNAKDFQDRTNKEYKDSIDTSNNYYDTLIANATENSIDTNKLELQKLENQLQIQKDYGQATGEIEAKIAKKKKEISDKEVEEDKKRFQKRIDILLQWMQVTEDGINALMQLNEAKAGKDDESQRKLFEKNKKLQIAQAVINTAEAVTAQLAVPQDAALGINFAKAAIALTTGIAQVKKIQNTKYESSNTTSSASSIKSPDIQPSGGAMQTNTISSTQLQLDAQGNLKQQQIRTYVLETDISDKQKRSSRLQKTATFGR
jgi:hypothetical protein